MFVRFWGTRGSIPTPGLAMRRYGGNTSCYEVRTADALFICDGGTGLRDLGIDLLRRSTAPIEAHLFFSHTHWDHIQGFPFFLPAYMPTNSFHVYDVEPGDRRVHQLLHGQMRAEYFPVAFTDLGAAINISYLQGGKSIHGVAVDYLELEHPGRSYAFSFVQAGCKVVYATDNELDRRLLNRGESLVRLDVMRRAPPDLVRFAAGAELLIADGQYSDEEYPSKVGWGHARANTVVDLAIEAGVKRLAITHHDPMHSDDVIEQMIAQARERTAAMGADLVVFAAREGLELKLG